jgi:hypothetical protein
MTTYHATYTDRMRQEVAQTPDEYLPLLLEMIHLFRQSLAKRGYEVALLKASSHPISTVTQSACSTTDCTGIPRSSCT